MTQINFSVVRSLFSPMDLSALKEHWSRLHGGDCEPWPESESLQKAWLLFHNGHFQDCANISHGQAGFETLRLKALSTYAHYLETDKKKKVDSLLNVVNEAESLLNSSSGEIPNIHYQLAFSLGRYGQFISVTKALSEGLASRISKALKKCMSIEPNHADAHTAYATYQAEIIGKLGKMAARFTYSATPEGAIEYYEKGVQLAPYSVSAKTEYADGLLTMFSRKKQKQAIELYQAAVSNPPVDALEALDYFLAQKELSEV